jgi:hypothetical protein
VLPYDSGTTAEPLKRRASQSVQFQTLALFQVEAMRGLPEIASDEVPADGDRQTFTVMVTDEDGKPVYTATLNFTGIWLLR